jgi:hypothetical protein
MNETALIPCPACDAMHHHPMLEGATQSRRDDCQTDTVPRGHLFENTQIAATCAACGHTWNMERRYSEPDTAAGINFGWDYPDGRIFYDFDRDKPAMLSPGSGKP